MTGKSEWGLLSVAIASIAYIWYMVQTLKGHAQPHPFSWTLFGIVTGTGYIIQVRQGAGPGSWVMGVTAAVCFLLAISTLIKGAWRWSDFDAIDWALVAVALVVFVDYLVTQAATLSAWLATATDVVAYGPTIKLRWRQPWRDSALSYTLNSAKFIPSILALESYSVATWLYPATLIAVNAAIAILLIFRRKYIPRPPNNREEAVSGVSWSSIGLF